jgi:hypothetical protein
MSRAPMGFNWFLEKQLSNQKPVSAPGENRPTGFAASAVGRDGHNAAKWNTLPS